MDNKIQYATWILNEDNKSISNPTGFAQQLKEIGRILQSDFLLNLLETNKENDNTIRQMRIAALDFRKEIRELKERENSALKRSNEYKEKFQSAQKIIEDLHEKNCLLAAKNKSIKKQYDYNNRVFKAPHPFFENEINSKKPSTVILAPDTCQVDNVPLAEDSILIEDEEDEPLEDPDATIFMKPNPPKSANSTIGMPCPRNSININGFSDEETIDLDETNFEFAPSSPVLNKRKSGNLVTAKRNSFEHSKDHLPGLKNNQSISFNTPKNLVAMLNSSTEESPSILPQVSKTKIMEMKAVEPDDTLETSLNDLFDRTDGDLEITTTMLHCQKNYSLSKMKLNSFKQSSNVPPRDTELQDSDDDFISPNQMCKSSNNKSAAFEKSIEITNNSTQTIDKENDKPNAALTNSEDSFWSEDSFNKLPSKAAPSFKHKSVVRDKEKRKNMEAKTCVQCDAFYSHLPEDKKREMLKKVCRHKYEFIPPSTPPHYWDVEMPTTQECRDRGYLKDQNISKINEPRKRRRKPLAAKHKKSS